MSLGKMPNSLIVVLAKAGTQGEPETLDSRLRGNDGLVRRAC